MDMKEFKRARTPEQREQRMQDIKAAADAMFSESPYHEITLTRIADRLGCSRTQIYKYTATKEEVFLELTEDKRGSYFEALLAAFPAEEFEKVAAKIEEKGLVKGRKVSRMLYASAVEVTPDKQGRIQLPAKLREYAGLDHDVTIIGNRSFAEIWNTEAWNANQATSDEDFTAAMEDLDF